VLLHLLQGAFVIATLAGLAAGLSVWAGRTRRRWALARAVLLGDRADPAATDRPAREVRFAAFAASLAAAIVAALALRDGLRGLGVVRLTLGLATIAPLLAVGIAALADAGRRGRRRLLAHRRARTSAPAPEAADLVTQPAATSIVAADLDPVTPTVTPTPAPAGAALAQCTDTVRAARHEVERARLAQPDEGVRAALDALDEALDEYAQALAGPERRARLDGVAALAQACRPVEAAPRVGTGVGAGAALEVAVNAQATPAGVWSLVDALVAISRAHPAADPAHSASLEAAARRLVGERPAPAAPEALVAPTATVALRLAA